MFYRLKRTHAIVEQRAPISDAVDNTNVIIIPAFGGTQSIAFATIHHVPLPKKGGAAPAGQIEVEIEYGPSASELDYCFRQVTGLGITIQGPSGGKERQAQLFTQIKLLEHTRK